MKKNDHLYYVLFSDKLFIYKVAKNYSYIDVVVYTRVKELLFLFIEIDGVI